jgi:uncharacterized protein
MTLARAPGATAAGAEHAALNLHHHSSPRALTATDRKAPVVDSFARLRRRKARTWLPRLLLPLAMLALTQCSHGPQVTIVGPGDIRRATVKIELAQTPAKRELGLMYRSNLAADDGMLFVFAIPSHVAFWMHNTKIPLDMIFADSDRNIIGIIPDATPFSDTQLAVGGNSQYVLEVNGGFCARHGVKVGDRLEFFNFIPHAVD